jgi:hypothetical protein
MAVAPSVVGLLGQWGEKIVTYESMMGAMAFATLFFIPLWLMASSTYRRAMSLPDETPTQTIRNRAIAYGLLAVFCIGFPFAQSYLQGRIPQDGAYPKLNAASTSP